MVMYEMLFNVHSHSVQFGTPLRLEIENKMSKSCHASFDINLIILYHNADLVSHNYQTIGNI